MALPSGQIAGTVTEISAKPVRLKAVFLLNTTASKAYFQIFNKQASEVTLGTTTPTWSIGLPADGGISVPIGDQEGIPFGGSGLSIAGTTTRTGLTGAAIDYNLAVS